MFVASAATKARLYSFRAPLLRLDYVRSGRRNLGSTVSVAGADPCRAIGASSARHLEKYKSHWVLAPFYYYGSSKSVSGADPYPATNMREP